MGYLELAPTTKFSPQNSPLPFDYISRGLLVIGNIPGRQIHPFNWRHTSEQAADHPRGYGVSKWKAAVLLYLPVLNGALIPVPLVELRDIPTELFI